MRWAVDAPTLPLPSALLSVALPVAASSRAPGPIGSQERLHRSAIPLGVARDTSSQFAACAVMRADSAPIAVGARVGLRWRCHTVGDLVASRRSLSDGRVAYSSMAADGCLHQRWATSAWFRASEPVVHPVVGCSATEGLCRVRTVA